MHLRHLRISCEGVLEGKSYDRAESAVLFVQYFIPNHILSINELDHYL